MIKTTEFKYWMTLSHFHIIFELLYDSTHSRTIKPQSEKPGIVSSIQDGEEVFFKIKNTTQLKKLMDAYCQRQSVIKIRYSSILPMSDSYSMERGLEILRPPKKLEWRMEIKLMLSLNKLGAQTFSDTFHLSPSFTLLFSYLFYWW